MREVVDTSDGDSVGTGLKNKGNDGGGAIVYFVD